MTAAVDAPDNSKALIFLLSTCNFVIGMGAFVPIGLLIPLSTDLAISEARAGTLLTTYALAYAVLSPLLVSATGGIGRRKVLVGGLALFAGANLLSATAPSESILHLSRILAAAGAGMVTPVTAAVAAATSAPEQRGKVLAAVFIGLTVSQVAGVPAGTWIGYAFGWRSAFAIVALLALPCLWALWVRVPRGLPFQPVGLRDLGRVLANPPVMLAVLFTTSFLGAIYIVYTYLGPLLTGTMGWGRDGVTAALLIFGIGAVAGNVLGGWLTDRAGAFRTLIGLAVIQVTLMPLFSLLPLSWTLTMGLVLLWSIFGWSFTAAQQVRIIALAPDAPSVVLSLNAAAIYVGAALGSALGGAVLAGMGLPALGIAGGLAAMLSVAHIALSRRISRR